jgi:glycyl-tRNA synthetase beta chain
MRWEQSAIKWVRPIRNLLCILNGKVLPLKYGELTANNVSFGHRFLAPQSFAVHSAEGYFSGLKKGKVILDLQERKSEITRQIADKLDEMRVIEDEGLLEEVAGLVEYPFVLLGEIDKKFLSLPREVIITTLKSHQKYFVLEDISGKLSPHFFVVSNMEPQDDGTTILHGNQKVLRARLDDAQFFFNEDRETRLESRVDQLKKIIFHEKIGTIFDKTTQTEQVIEKISSLSPIKFDLSLAKRAARLAKADLTTNLVKEFPELQGMIGKYYAQLDRENQIVSDAIADHYLPKGTEDNFPTSIEGAVLAISDKISTLCDLFAAGEIPTSSKDPYALRRQAVGIVKLICHFKVSLDMNELIKYSMNLVQGTDIGPVMDFLSNRFKFFLKDQFETNLIEATLATSNGNFYSDFNKLICLAKFIESPEGKATLLSIKRISNILGPISKIPSKLNEELFNEYEQNLHAALMQAQLEIKPFLAHENHEAALEIFSKLSAIIDILFDKVLIMNDDEQIRNNRLCLLNETNKFFLSFANFSLID